MDKETEKLIAKAEKIYSQNFHPLTCFERAIFFSWGCTVGDCAFCYMSTQPQGKKATETKRTKESILAEFLLAKKLGWEIGFFTGGIGVYQPEELELLLKDILTITEEKIWLSVGPLSKELLQRFLPYTKGVVGSIETINQELHHKICPSKPVEPYLKMFREAKKLDLKCAMTFIVGVGESREDCELLIGFIKEYNLDKIHVYGLIPEKGTIFEDYNIPSAEEQAWWIAQLRIAFPSLDIQCGVWEDRLERVSLLLKAGANSISKFKALKLFATPLAKLIEEEAAQAGRTFHGTLTHLPEVDWDEEVNRLPLEKYLKERIKIKLKKYLIVMERNKKSQSE